MIGYSVHEIVDKLQLELDERPVLPPMPSSTAASSRYAELEAVHLAIQAAQLTHRFRSKGRHKTALMLGWQLRKQGLPEQMVEIAAREFLRFVRQTDSDGAASKPLRPDDVIDAVRNAYREGKVVHAEDRSNLDTIDAKTLLEREFPDLVWVVDGILPAGLGVLAGRPKAGKSWLAMAIAIGVTAERSVLGQAVQKGQVLYLALEDTERRLKSRLKKLKVRMTNGDASWASRLHFRTSWPNLADGATDAMREFLVKHEGTRLLVVDTLQKIRSPTRKDQNVYAEDYLALAELKSIADEFNIAVLVVTHLRKQAADDPFDAITGSTGITGAADVMFVLQRQRGEDTAVLKGTGRDLPEEIDLGLAFDSASALWEPIGSGEFARSTAVRREIIEALRDEPMKPMALSRTLGKTDGAVRKIVRQMLADGQLRQDDSGRYFIPGGRTGDLPL